MSPSPEVKRPARRLAAVDLHRLAGKEARIEIALEHVRKMIRIGHGAVARADCPLGRLDQAMNVIEAFGFGNAEAVEQRKDHQRGNALGRRVGVVDHAYRQIDAQRFGNPGLIARQVVPGDGAADAFKIGRDLTPDVAAIEIVEAGIGEMRQRPCELFLLQSGPGRRHFAVNQKRRGEARHRRQIVKVLPRQPLLASRHPVTVAGMAERIGQKHFERQRAAAAFAACSASIQPPPRPAR